jgi:hypothetical protein
MKSSSQPGPKKAINLMLVLCLLVFIDLYTMLQLASPRHNRHP